MNISNDDYSSHIFELTSSFTKRYQQRVVRNNVIRITHIFFPAAALLALLQAGIIFLFAYNVSWLTLLIFNESFLLIFIFLAYIKQICERPAPEEVIKILDYTCNTHDAILNSYYLSQFPEKDNYAVYAIENGIKHLRNCKSIKVPIRKKILNIPLVLICNLILIVFLGSTNYIEKSENIITAKNSNNLNLTQGNISENTQAVSKTGQDIVKGIKGNSNVKPGNHEISDTLNLTDIPGNKSKNAVFNNSGGRGSQSDIESKTLVSVTNLDSLFYNEVVGYKKQQQGASGGREMSLDNYQIGRDIRGEMSNKINNGNEQPKLSIYDTFDYSLPLYNLNNASQNEGLNKRDFSIPAQGSTYSSFNIDANENITARSNSNIKYENQMKASRLVSTMLAGITKPVEVRPLVSKGERIGITNAARPGAAIEVKSTIGYNISDESSSNYTYSLQEKEQSKRYFELLKMQFGVFDRAALSEKSRTEPVK